MRLILAAIPAMLALGALTAPPAAARTSGDHWHNRFEDNSAAAQPRSGKAAQKGRRTARATLNDSEEESYERQASPRRAERANRRVHAPRHAKRTHARSKHARSVRGGPRHANRPASWRRTTVARLPVRGHRVEARPAGTAQQGIASYYWQGQRLATGGRFNPDGISAAHRTLPFGTRVRVTHLRNGRSVDVRINDRGPYIAGRIIDLSRGAARVIGMTGQGVAQVRVTVLGR